MLCMPILVMLQAFDKIEEDARTWLLSNSSNHVTLFNNKTGQELLAVTNSAGLLDGPGAG